MCIVVRDVEIAQLAVFSPDSGLKHKRADCQW